MLDFQTAFGRRGLAGQTSSPMNADDVPPGAPPYASGPLANLPPTTPTPAPRSLEQDLPPGAPPYAGGPLANPPPPTPPPRPSLTTLANGGQNHAQAWMSGSSSPQSQFEQKPFNGSNGSIATKSARDHGEMAPFAWSTALQDS